MTKPQPKKRSEQKQLPPSPHKPSALPSPPKQQQSPKNKRGYLGKDIDAVEKEEFLPNLERVPPPIMGFVEPKEDKPPENTVAALPCATDHKSVNTKSHAVLMTTKTKYSINLNLELMINSYCICVVLKTP